MKNSSPFSTLSADIPAALVVALVALPLCLGVALASGAPLFSGIIAGVVGGIIVGALSKSPLSVSGPAAGLTVIVLGAIQSLPSYEAFLAAVVLAGILQIGFGLCRAGILGDFIPSSVIKGMLAAIGLILILKQFPHAVGFDSNYIGDESMSQHDGDNTFSAIWHALQSITTGPTIIAVVSAIILLGWEKIQKIIQQPFIKLVPGPLIAVVVAVVLNKGFAVYYPEWVIMGEHLVSVPVAKDWHSFTQQFYQPDFQMFVHPEIWKVAFTLALVASIESLLSIEAVDKLDRLRRVTPTNRELIAQGVGNMTSGLLGGLPVTSVIVRSSANVEGGAKTKLSTILHGVFLLISVVVFPEWLNQIPLSVLAVVLIIVGYKLAKPQIVIDKYHKGLSHLVPYVATVLAILLTDLLIGIGIGLVVGIIFMLLRNYRSPLLIAEHADSYLLRARKELFFIHKYELKQALARIPANKNVIIDLSRIYHVDLDNIDIIEDFMANAPHRHLTVKLKLNQESINQAGFLPPPKQRIQNKEYKQ
jgi:MFS superfamily sulfate permease-like transporter